MNRLCVAALSLMLVIGGLAWAEPTNEEPSKKPITTDKGEVGKLLTKWYKDGTAAGNVGDYYDNRDGAHSDLNTTPYPQLRRITYSDDDIKARRHWAFMPTVRKQVTFGNSSTSGPPQLNGSNPRSGYCSPQGLQILDKQYLGNNLYIYPEHRDHDPGHNGVGDGYGDLFPTNTPYLLISQGSSGSDQPFMRAVPFTLSAFRPDVKKKLIESGLLMPTVQMILRSSNKNIKEEKEYLTGKAHPTVFEGSNVDVMKMVRLAHAIQPNTIPPLVKLKVTKEDKLEQGKDYFEPIALTEQHSDTSSVIARIWRGSGQKRKLVVSAEDSVNLSKQPLTFKWVVLRGDEKRITITPKNKTGSVAEITVLHHDRRPIEPGSKMESNRVDIGIFAHNGSYYSTPGFVTFYSFDSESRAYDEKGRVIEIAYGRGESELKIPDYAKLFAELRGEGLATKILGITEPQRKELAELAKAVIALQLHLHKAQKYRQEATADRNKAVTELRQAQQKLAQAKKDKKEKEINDATAAVEVAKLNLALRDLQLKAANEEITKAEKNLNSALNDKRDALKMGARPFVDTALARAKKLPSLWNDHVAELGKVSTPRVESARKKLLNLGIVKDGKDGAFILTPARSGKGKADRSTAFERSALEEFNSIVLSESVLPKVSTHTFRVNFVDGRLTAPKAWRDVYRPDGSWTRYSPTSAKPAEFTAEGWLVTEKDDKGRPKTAQTVNYKQDPPPKNSRWVNPNLLKHVAGEEMITFEYDGDTRKIKSREKVLESK